MTTPRMRRIVVVGNGIAGLTAADALRTLGFDGALTVVGDEAHAPYSRPALSKAVLAQDGEPTAHLLPPPDHGGDERRGCSAVGVDPGARHVRLSDGSIVPYDGLVVASGSRARRLSASPREVTLRSVDDACALRARLADRPRVVVVGSGALAMEVASGAVAAGCHVDVVVRRPAMSRHVGDMLSALLREGASRAGVVFHGSAGTRIVDEPGAATVILDDGTGLVAELVVSAVGDVANTEWLAGTGLLHGGELHADSRGRVAPGVVAAGDVAAYPAPGGPRRVPLWTNAIETAKVAAAGLLFGDAAPELDYQPYFWTEQFGMSLKVCGALPVEGDPAVHQGDLGERRAVLRWEHGDGTATAAALNLRIAVPRLRALTAATAA